MDPGSEEAQLYMKEFPNRSIFPNIKIMLFLILKLHDLFHWLKSTSHLYRGQGRLHPLFTSNALMYDAVQVIDKRSLYGTKVVLTITGSGQGSDRPGQPSCTEMSNQN